jgi:glycosyltransferase involved in cell wall biosynthesis
MADTRRPEDAPNAIDPTRADGARLVRMDMHVHSKASARPVFPIFGLIDAPECCSEPEAIFDQAHARGMDLVAITDHDEIWGALELIERGFPGVVVGQEVTVRFPRHGHPVHVLLWGLTPEQHLDIAARNLRDDIHEFALWVREQGLPHAVAHPIDGLGDGRCLARLERLALLFRSFELLNGAHPGGHRPTIERWLASLTPERLAFLSRKHALTPVYPTDLPRAVTAGSDDHGLLNVGRTWAGVPGDRDAMVADPARFLRAVMAGGATVGGQAGHPALMAHQFMSVAANRFAGPVSSLARPRQRMALRQMARLAGVDLPRPSLSGLALDTLRRKTIHRGRPTAPVVRALADAFPRTLEAFPEVARRMDPSTWADGAPLADHERAQAFIETLCNRVTRDLARGGVDAFDRRDWNDLKRHLDGARWLLLAQASYFISLTVHNKERWAMTRLEHEHAAPGEGPLDREPRVLVFTDTLADINGVSRFIRDVGRRAGETGRELHIFTSTEKRCPDLPCVRNFQPVYATTMPKYPELDLVVPPALSMLRAADELKPDVIHVSTPGAVGLVGLAAAATLRTPVLGVYHTDFPAYIERLFRSETMGRQCSRAMRMFYARFHTVFARSEAYREAVGRLGVPQKRIRTFPAGIDIEAFHPRHRDQGLWKRITTRTGDTPRSWSIKALYCGRVSVEKNTPMLDRVWPEIRRRCAERNIEAELVIVGDGPDRQRLEEALKRHGVHFLGFRHGAELSAVYASCDLFIFPSVTDTLGQVVMESQASGIPAIVSDQGGPATIVRDGETGFVAPVGAPERWIDRAVDLLTDATQRARMGDAARQAMETRGFAGSFDAYWDAHVQAWRDHLKTIGVRPRRERARSNGVAVNA